MKLRKPRDLLRLSPGDSVGGRNLFDLIKYSKVTGSRNWGGEREQIQNTPQQGINWIGDPPVCRAVLIKTKVGAYENDGWADDSKSTYHYSFKVRKGKVSYSEKANSVLIRQPQYQYPILLFSKAANSYLFEGTFSVRDIEASHVVLERGLGLANGQRLPQEEALYQEGGKKYVTHLLAERNRSVVKILKDRPSANCEICNVRFSERYGVDYIEAHHKVPVATYSSTYTVTPEDFALLCPNCHRAVHIYMKKEGLEYSQIKKRLQRGAA